MTELGFDGYEVHGGSWLRRLGPAVEITVNRTLNEKREFIRERYGPNSHNLTIVAAVMAPILAIVADKRIGTGPTRNTATNSMSQEKPLKAKQQWCFDLTGENPFCDAGLWQAADYFGVGFRWHLGSMRSAGVLQAC